jgi:hypothetical protein
MGHFSFFKSRSSGFKFPVSSFEFQVNLLDLAIHSKPETRNFLINLWQLCQHRARLRANVLILVRLGKMLEGGAHAAIGLHGL